MKTYFSKINTISTPYTPGMVYFDSGRKLIHVAISETELETYCKYNTGVSKTSYFNNIPTTENVCYVNLKNSQTLGISEDIINGRDLTIIVHNDDAASINLYIPTLLFEHTVITNNSSSSKSITLDSDGYLELSIIKVNNIYFIRYA